MQCTSQFPGEPGYFVNGGSGVAGNRNQIWGDYVQTNHLSGLDGGDGSPLVHIIANATDPELNTPGQYTFYGRLHDFTALDNREPLTTTFMTRYASIPMTGFQPTNLTVWRDNKGPQGFFACGTTPAWYPLKQKEIVFFDEQERPVKLTTLPLSDTPTPFPAGTQRVQVGSSKLPSAFSSGIVYLNLQTTIAGNPNPPEDLAGGVDAGVGDRPPERHRPLQHRLSRDRCSIARRAAGRIVLAFRSGISARRSSARVPSIGTTSSGTCLLVVASRSVPLNAPAGIVGRKRHFHAPVMPRFDERNVRVETGDVALRAGQVERAAPKFFTMSTAIGLPRSAVRTADRLTRNGVTANSGRTKPVTGRNARGCFG